MTARVVVMMVASLAAGAAAAADLGRMFFTPEQRAALDKSRKQTSAAEIEREFKPPPPPLPQNVSVTGLIRRSDGKHTIWLNNRIVDERQTGSVKAGMGKRDNQVRLRIPDSGKRVDLKVGQTLEIVSGTIEENYARRATAGADAATAAGGENRAADMPKVTPSQSREPVKSESSAQKRSARAADSDVAEDFGSKPRLEAK